MHPNAETITRFYSAFQKHDGAAMVACYHPDVHFSDPVFPDLRGAEARAMWLMFCERSSDLTVTFSDVSADDTQGRAHWEAHYPFSQTGRRVHNRIDARFEFRDGLIVRHQDSFDFYAWTRMALGPTGVLLGWSPFVQNKVRRLARKALEKSMASSRT